MVQKTISFGFRMVLFIESSERAPWRKEKIMSPLGGLVSKMPGMDSR